MARLVTTGRMQILVAVADSTLRQEVERHLTALGLDYAVIQPARIPAWGQGKAVFCICCPTAASLSRIPWPAAVICAGSLVSNHAVAAIVESGAVVIDEGTLSTQTLIEGLVRATGGLDEAALKRHLLSARALEKLPVALVETFLRNPASQRSIRDVCRCLGSSLEGARALVHESGFDRAEHTWTALRAEAWVWFAQQGVRRSEFERYLGIRDRRIFRRACHRAGVIVPWRRPAPSA